MNKRKLCATSAASTIAIIAIMLPSVFAEGMYNFDSESGAYTTVEVGVCGNYWYDGKLYAPAAYVKGTIDTDLPGGSTLKIQYIFQWLDEDLVLHTQNETIPSSATKAGEWIKVEPSELPYVVWFIVAEGRAGYGDVWDTEWACASLPWV